MAGSTSVAGRRCFSAASMRQLAQPLAPATAQELLTAIAQMRTRSCTIEPR